jgi:hypothetical protein
MVPRTALVAALAKARSGGDEAQAMAGELESKERLLRKAKERIEAYESELSELKSTLAGSVPRSDLVAAQARSDEEDARARAALSEMREKSTEWQAEVSQLRAALQVFNPIMIPSAGPERLLTTQRCVGAGDGATVQVPGCLVSVF